MKGAQIALDTLGGHLAAVRLEDGRLEDLLVDPPAGTPRLGAIFRATVTRPAKGQGGAFVDLGSGLSGFLRAGQGHKTGHRLAVQVTGFAEPGKAVPVSARLLHKGRLAIVTPDAPGVNLSRALRDEGLRAALADAAAGPPRPEQIGIVVRSAAAEAAPEALAEEVAELLSAAAATAAGLVGAPACLDPGPDPAALASRDWPDVPRHAVDGAPGAFARHGVDTAIDGLRQADEPLGSDGTLWVEATRALVAVDIDTGLDGGAAAGLRTNIAAARALPRALRLRGLGGQITVDPAPMPKKNRNGFEAALRAALRTDPVETALVGWTPLGHFELQRKRERLPLQRVLP